MSKHYKALGLQEGASQEEIEAAYQALGNKSILATKGGAHKNILDQPTPSKKMDIPPQATNNSFAYLLRRKRNIITFIVLVLILKPVLHFSLLPEIEQFVNYDKKIDVSSESLLKIIQVYEFEGDSLVQVKKRPTYIWEYDGKYTKNGEVYILQRSTCTDCSTHIFYYPKEIRCLSFKTHIQQTFKVKLYLFFILILILSLIVFLFNDKIKAR